MSFMLQAQNTSWTFPGNRFALQSLSPITEFGCMKSADLVISDAVGCPFQCTHDFVKTINGENHSVEREENGTEKKL